MSLLQVWRVPHGVPCGDDVGLLYVVVAAELPWHNAPSVQIKELLQAFGPLKAFHLVKDPGATNSKVRAWPFVVSVTPWLFA